MSVALLSLLSLLSFSSLSGCATTGAAPAQTPPLPASAVCPVAKETFPPTAETATAEYDGKTYYFCCPSCKGEFLKDPGKYTGAGKKEP
ncbi:MAG: YHS domain-containing protein [Deltaproteobacteria bacterium]|nr:YHS domain-containing protein [Deltaproteobacteria bacterium]